VHWYEWVFDGIGAAVVVAILGAIVNYIIGRRRKSSTLPPDAQSALYVRRFKGNVIVNQPATPELIHDIVEQVVARVKQAESRPTPETGGPEEPVEVVLESQAEEKKYQLAKAINSLPEREKIVVTLHYYEGLEIDEIAKTLGVTAARVQQSMGHALRKLGATLR
jgi:RNA polymerase sigma factor (sigma-70 family)